MEHRWFTLIDINRTVLEILIVAVNVGHVECNICAQNFALCSVHSNCCFFLWAEQAARFTVLCVLCNHYHCHR